MVPRSPQRPLGYRTAAALRSLALMKGGGAVRLEKDEALKEWSAMR
jgi:hypothetical protein